MANDQSHNMLWKDHAQLVIKQEEDPLLDYSNHILHDDIISSRSFNIYEYWDLDLLQQQSLFENDPANIQLLDDTLQMLPETSFNPDYSLLPSFDMELMDPISAYFGFEDYVVMNNNVVICQEDDLQQQQQNQMALMTSGVISSNETLAVSDELAWPDQNNYNIIDGGGRGKRRIMTRAAGAKRSREDDNSCSKAITLSREAISEYFYMPITQAAKEMNIGLTLLKKRCREVGIRRWPHRKLMSLQTLINNVQEMGDGMEQKKSKAVVEMLENEMRLMEQIPDRELGENTKKLRQACFKANYKKRKLVSPPDSCSSSSSSLFLTVPDS